MFVFFSLQKKLKSGSMHRTLTVWLPDEKLVAKEGKEGTSTTFYQQIVTTLTFGPTLSMKKLSGKICELTTCALHYLVSISKYIHRSLQLRPTEIWGEIFSLTEHYQLFLLDPFYIFVIRKGAIWGGILYDQDIPTWHLDNYKLKRLYYRQKKIHTQAQMSTLSFCSFTESSHNSRERGQMTWFFGSCALMVNPLSNPPAFH